MFRILIVDDERIILNGIRMLIEEELQLSFATDIAVASNVPKAKELFDAFHPNLILTDIRMPVLDGFELIRYVREQEPSQSIAILSSHADFEYAQQAIRYGVVDFILKPIDSEILKSTIEQVYQQKKNQEQNRISSALVEIRNMMLYDLSVHEMVSDSKYIQQLFPYAYFTVIVLEISRVQDSYRGMLEKLLLRQYSKCYCFYLRERNQLIAICNHDQFQVKTRGLEREFADESGCGNLWVGISIGATSYKALHGLYMNALQRVFYAKHFDEDNSLIEMSLITYQDCIRVFKENDVQSVRRSLQEYLNKTEAIIGQSDASEKIYQSFFYNILMYLENNLISVPAELSDMKYYAVKDQTLLDIIMDRLMKLKGIIKKENEYEKHEMLMKQLMEYIEQHYREDISLEELAGHVGLHPNYVCAVFKKKAGHSYLTYVHRERLQYAKRLLLETDYTIDQIAAEVGYNSASQFARVFRKYENVSPSGFRYLDKKYEMN